MEFIKLDNLSLNIVDKNDRIALEFIRKLCHDESIKKRFQGILGGVLNNPSQELFGYGFLVSHNGEYIGYVRIGNFIEEEKSIYLRAAIDSDKRGHSYGKMLLSEITEYIFQNYSKVESIRLKIAEDNKPSLMTANACGYVWLKDDYYIKYNPYLDNVIKR